MAVSWWIGPPEDPDRYELGLPVGSDGGEGRVYRATLFHDGDSGTPVAVKVMPTSGEPDEERRWNRQRLLLQARTHPGIANIIDMFLGPPLHERGRVAPSQPADVDTLLTQPQLTRYQVLEWIDGVDLQDWIDENNDATISQRLRLLVSTANALDFLHGLTRDDDTRLAAPSPGWVAHGDVKPKNIMVASSGKRICLIDPGMTRISTGTGKFGFTPPYTPAWVAGLEATPVADRWAFLVTTVQTLTGEKPPTANGRSTDVDGLIAQVRAAPRLSNRIALRDSLISGLREAAPTEARPRDLLPLSTWLSGLRDAGTTTLPPGPRPPAPPTPASRRLQRLAVLTAVLALLGGSAAAAAERHVGPFHRNTGTTAAPPRRTTTPTPTPTPTPTAVTSSFSTASSWDDSGSVPDPAQVVAPATQAIKQTVDYLTLCQTDPNGDTSSCNPQSVDIGDSLFTYDQSTYAGEYPQAGTLRTFQLTTCSRLTLTFAGVNESQLSEPSDVAYLEVKQSTGKNLASAPFGKVGTLVVDLTPGEDEIVVGSTYGQKNSWNTGVGDLVAVRGSATCTSASGT